MAAFVGRAPVARDAFPLGEACHHGGTAAAVELLTHPRVGHGGVVTFDLDGVINMDPSELPLGLLLGLGRQGRERRAGEGVKECRAGARPLLAGTGLQGR